MAQTAHTPGPWTVAENGRYINYHNDVVGTSFFLIHETFRDEFKEEQAANMALIAAAPDLLEALNACFPYMHDLDAENFADASAGIIEDYTLSEAFRKMKAAIAKATNPELSK